MSTGRFELLEAAAAIAVARRTIELRKQASWGAAAEALKGGVSRAATEVGSSLAEGGRAAMDTIQAMATTPPIEQIRAARDHGVAAAKSYLTGEFNPDGSYQPPYIAQTPELIRKYVSDPANQKNVAFAAGGAAAAAVASRYMHRRAERQKKDRIREYLAELQMPGKVGRSPSSLEVKQAGTFWDGIKDNAGGLYDRASKAVSDAATKYKVGDTVVNAQQGLTGKAQEWVDMIKAGLEDPKYRPAVTAAIGAAGVGSANVLAEAMNRRKKKRYLNAFLTGAGAGGLMGGAYGALMKPHFGGLTLSTQDPAITQEARAQAEAFRNADPATKQKMADELQAIEKAGTPGLIEKYITDPAKAEAARHLPEGGLAGAAGRNPLEAGILGAGVVGAGVQEGRHGWKDWQGGQKNKATLDADLAREQRVVSDAERPRTTPAKRAKPAKVDKFGTVTRPARPAVPSRPRLHTADETATIAKLREAMAAKAESRRLAPMFISEHSSATPAGMLARRVYRSGLPLGGAALAASAVHGARGLFDDATNTGDLSGLTPLPSPAAVPAPRRTLFKPGSPMSEFFTLRGYDDK
jgi:hypothetical protein